jgi:NAD(P)-dependent dehydrogenase (short-subunit alcohol dehydrogenase family)
MKLKTVIVTGANRGIGLALCQTYLAKGANIIAVCRKASEALKKHDLRIIEGVDVSTEEGINHLKASLNEPVHQLINNAGILSNQRLSNLNYQQMLEQYKVNTLGPLRVTEAVLPHMDEGAKIGLITSRMGSIEDNSSGGTYGYRMSKCALNAAGKSLSIDLKGRGIAVALLHPGYVQTEMVNFGGDISAELSAQRLVERMDELNMSNSGSFWHSNGEVLPW